MTPLPSPANGTLVLREGPITDRAFGVLGPASSPNPALLQNPLTRAICQGSRRNRADRRRGRDDGALALELLPASAATSAGRFGGPAASMHVVPSGNAASPFPLGMADSLVGTGRRMESDRHPAPQRLPSCAIALGGPSGDVGYAFPLGTVDSPVDSALPSGPDRLLPKSIGARTMPNGVPSGNAANPFPLGTHGRSVDSACRSGMEGSPTPESERLRAMSSSVPTGNARGMLGKRACKRGARYSRYQWPFIDARLPVFLVPGMRLHVDCARGPVQSRAEHDPKHVIVPTGNAPASSARRVRTCHAANIGIARMAPMPLVCATHTHRLLGLGSGRHAPHVANPGTVPTGNGRLETVRVLPAGSLGGPASGREAGAQTKCRPMRERCDAMRRFNVENQWSVSSSMPNRSQWERSPQIPAALLWGEFAGQRGTSAVADSREREHDAGYALNAAFPVGTIARSRARAAARSRCGLVLSYRDNPRMPFPLGTREGDRPMT